MDDQPSARDAKAAGAITDLLALMAEVRANVNALKAILVTPEVPSGDTAHA